MNSEIINLKQELVSLESTKISASIQNEESVFLDKLSEKDKEIEDLKNSKQDIETQLIKLQQSLNESNKNLDNLIKVNKSAEIMNSYKNKIDVLLEEKAVLTETHRLIANNLSNEILELKKDLNEYEIRYGPLKQEIKASANTKEEDKLINKEPSI